MGRSFPLLWRMSLGKLVLILFRLWLAAAILHLPTPAQERPLPQEALYRLAREASTFWRNAPAFLARETIHQRALVVYRKRSGALDPRRKAEWKSQDINSWYALGYFRRAPEALREFRRVFEVDGKPLEDETDAKLGLASQMKARDDDAKADLLKQFEDRTLAGAATDFGQVLLLFTKSNLNKYSFEQTGQARVGADAAWVISFSQVGGNQSLRIVDGRKKLAQKLQGEILVRQGDYLPLRITLTSTRQQKDSEIRDEASVDYSVTQASLLPASLTYRRFVDQTMMRESTHRYSAWERR